MTSATCYFGVDYYPEHWDPALLDDDIARIAAMGATMIRIGEFAWHLMEPTPGAFDFSYFDHVIMQAEAAGLTVLFGTPTATFPAWLATAQPEILSVGLDRQPRVFGGRRQYCYNSPVYREHADRIVTALVAHYADWPAVVAWQVDNEFGHEGSDDCYCDTCERAWRVWLAARYGDIGNLNERWGTIFWGQTYDDFDQIPMPLPTITTHSPSLKLDWARFRSDSLNGFANDQVALVRSLAGQHQTITTNLSGGFFGKLYDHVANVANLDVVSYDNYPVWGGLAEPMEPAAIAMTLDFVRGLKRENFWIVEQLMGAQGHDIVGYLPRPKQAQMWAYQAVGHGCETMLWFRWRGMTRGAEQHCLGIIDVDNGTGRKYHEVAEAIAEFRAHEDVLTAPISATVAVVYDMDNAWAWRAQRLSEDFDYTDEIVRMHRPFHRLNLAVDVVPSDTPLDDYRVVALPAPLIADPDLVARLTDFVTRGGTLVVGYRAGTKDRDNVMPFGLAPPGLLRDLCGVTAVEAESLGSGRSVALVGHGELAGQVGECAVWRDLVQPAVGTEVLARYDDSYADYACITRASRRAGRVYYVGGGVDADTMADLGRIVAQEQDLPVIDTAEGLEVMRRALPGGGYADIVANHTAELRHFAGREFGPYSSAIMRVQPRAQ